MKTRKQKRQKGGKVLGKGAKGTVLTVPCTNSPSFCTELREKGSAVVRIFTLQKEKFRLQQETYKTLLKMISARDDIVVKQFLPSYKSYFQNEMNAMHTIYSSLGKHFVEKYTAYITLSIKDKEVAGFQIGDTSYFLNKRCHETLLSQAKHISANECKHMIQSILTILEHFQKKGLYHNDIKMDNIMKCENEFMLIDMEKMLDSDTMENAYVHHKVSNGQQPYGSVFVTSPIALYMYNKTLKPFVYSSIGSVPYTIIHGYPFTVTALREYLQFYETNILETARTILQTNKSPEQLFDQYHPSFDTYALGATIAQLYFIQRGALPKKFLEFATRLVNPLHPEFAGSTKEASAIFKRLLSE